MRVPGWRRRSLRAVPWLVGLGGVLLAASAASGAEPGTTITLQVGGEEGMSVSLKVVLFLTALTFLPAAVMTMTSFTRIVVVLAFLRQALGTQQTPPNQVLIGLALFLTLFIMAPVWEQVNAQALQPYLEHRLNEAQALERAAQPIREFMLKQTREKDLRLFTEIARLPLPERPEDIPLRVVLPAFIISELRTAFQIGFLLYVPFLILDMVVASVLLSMGMMMLPPIVISLPFKLLLFVLVDGWSLVVGSLVRSFG